MYDSSNNVIGFEYSQLSELNEALKTTRVYYEKNLQGDVTGPLDARVAIVLMALQQYIAVIANIITIVSIVMTVKKLTLNIPTGLWNLKQSIWHNHK